MSVHSDWKVSRATQQQITELFVPHMLNDLENATENEGFNDSEIDVVQLMSDIRESIVRRGIDINAPYDPAVMLSVQQPTPMPGLPAQLRRLKLAPEFEPSRDDRYHVNELLRFHDSDFVRNAYEAILKREADEKGFRKNLESLGGGEFNKIDVLGSLLYSDEGKKTGVKIDGLKLPYTIRRLERIPLLGYVLQLALGLARLPRSIRNQRQFEAYVVSQQYLIADHIHQQSVELSRRQQQQGAALAGSLRENLDQLSAFRGAVQARFAKGEERLGETESLNRLLSDRLNQAIQESESARAEHSERQKRLQAEIQSLGIQLHRSLPDTPAELEESQALYAAFEEHFRGDPGEIRERLKFYLPVIREAVPGADILDLGSGYGDWLDLLKENGHKARGVENNRFMIERCRLRGLDVIDEDVMVHLGSLADNSVGVVTAFHLIEHLPFQTLIRLLGEVQRVLKPGGLIILETPNPENLVVAACNFYSDPTHHRPIYPHTLTFILDSKGFANLRLEYLHPVEDSPFNADDPTLQALNTWFYGARDFAVMGRKN